MTAFIEGVHINYKGPNVSTYGDNMRSVYKHRDAMRAKIQHELEEGRVEAIDINQFPVLKINPIGVVLKSTLGKWHMISHLSVHLDVLSVNERLDHVEKTVTYAKLDEALKVIANCGRGALLAKVDLLACFRRFSVFQGDFYLLGFKFEGQVFVDKVLSMDLLKAIKIAEELSTILEWKFR